MWFLSFVPDAWLQWAIHALVLFGLILGIVGAIGKNIPFISQYGIIVKAIGGLLFIAGVFFEGGYGVEMSYRAKIADMQEKIDVAQKQSAKVNIKIQERIVEKIQIIKEKANDITREIETNRDAINAECKLSDDAWVLYNRATQNAVSGSAGKSDGKGR